MPYLGRTGFNVSPLCFGTLALSPLQGFRDEKQGAEILRYALEQGVNFIDTAELYDNYQLLGTALKGIASKVFVATKSYAFSRQQMAESLEKARRGLNRDVIDIFLLHEQESSYTLKGHAEALEYLAQAKERGMVGAIGISTHAVDGVRAGASLPEIDVIHPILNVKGLGIIDGDLEQMLRAIELARQMGKGIYAMKALGGGHLGTEPVQALNFARRVPGVASVAVGMTSKLEVDTNLRIFADRDVPAPWLETLTGGNRILHVAEWCQGCGRCVAKCPQAALYLEKEQVKVKHSECVLCGYCGAECPHFCLKILRQEVKA